MKALSEFQGARARLGAILLATAIGVAGCGQGPAPVRGAINTADAAAAAGASGEGIKVHGWWTIEVRNPNGRVTTHREFENRLESPGRSAISMVLGHAKVPARWGILLGNYEGPSPCRRDGLPVECMTFEALAGEAPQGTSNTLIVSHPEAGTDAGKLILAGQVLANAVGAISHVSTTLALCDWADRATCGEVGGRNPALPTGMTFATFDRIPVETGQQVLVTVKLSFS